MNIPRHTRLLVLAAISALAALVPSEASAALAADPEPEKPPEPPRAKSVQAPSVGRVVHFHFKLDGELVTRPAMIVRVWSDTCVNLRVFLDGENDQRPQPTPDWQTSRLLAAEPKEGHWSWPPFVPGK